MPASARSSERSRHGGCDDRGRRSRRRDGGEERRRGHGSHPDREPTRAAPRARPGRAARGAVAPPREIPSKHLYDERGSQLFERICELPEYYQTRTERALLERHADGIVLRSGAGELVEIGSGAATKTRVVLRAMERHGLLTRYVPIDVDVAMLERVAAELVGEFPGLHVHGIVADFDHSLDRLPPGDRRLIAFLGSTIGNLRPADQAPELMRSIRGQMRAGDHFLLGVDLIKDRARLEAAYNDSRGVTAAFSRNILRTSSTASPTPTSTATRSAIARSGTSATAGWTSVWSPSARSTSSCGRSTSSSTSPRARRSAPRSAPSTTGRAPRRCFAAGGFELVEWITDDENLFALAVGAAA